MDRLCPPVAVPGPTTGALAYTDELSDYLERELIPSVKPTQLEYSSKEATRVYLESLVTTLSPGAKLLPFGSMANGFALKNSDMDLCCFLGKLSPTTEPAILVQLLGNLIQQETNYHVLPLPRARIPIIKLTLPPSVSLPFGMSCDIGFENRLALENTRLLLTYAMVDNRLRTIVLFLKVWTKRRKINDPYRGTLSSYGYVLLVIWFLQSIKDPPVLPNLQRIPPAAALPLSELEYEGHDISFFDDLESLPLHFDSENRDSSGQLLIQFFHFFSKVFDYARSVVSIRAPGGTMTKVEKGWPTEDHDGAISRDQHKLCIEDPFQLDYNVARTVTSDGLYTIRGEFIRAHRILTTTIASSPDTPGGASTSNLGSMLVPGRERMAALVKDLCGERGDHLEHHPVAAPTSSFPHHSYVLPTSQSSSLQSAMAPSLPQQSFSPRRRSAPSPTPSSRVGGSPRPSTSATFVNGSIGPSSGPGMEDFRSWAKRNGVAGTAGLGYDADLSREEIRGLGGGDGERDGAQSSRPPLPALPRPYRLAGPLHASPNAYDQSRTLERRASWEATTAQPTASLPIPAPSTSASSPTTHGTATTPTSYDLHRFFQNQPGDPSPPSSSRPPLFGSSQSDGGAGASYADLASSHATQSQGPGRSPFRYSQSFLSSTGPGRIPSTSLPPQRNYSSYPSSPAATHQLLHFSASSSQGYSRLPPPPHPYQAQQGMSASSGGMAPSPIFPVEDRETIIAANSITFGNFSSAFGISQQAPGLSAIGARGSWEGEDIFGTRMKPGAGERGRKTFAEAQLPTSSSVESSDARLAPAPSVSVDVGGRRRGRSVPHLSNGAVGQGERYRSDRSIHGGVWRDGDGKELEILRVRFGQVETEFFLKGPTSADVARSRRSVPPEHGDDAHQRDDRSSEARLPTFMTIPPTPLKVLSSIPALAMGSPSLPNPSRLVQRSTPSSPTIIPLSFSPPATTPASLPSRIPTSPLSPTSPTGSPVTLLRAGAESPSCTGIVVSPPFGGSPPKPESLGEQHRVESLRDDLSS